jgi:hypothetical protein
LTKVYNDPAPGPRPGRSAAEEVLVHMMFALIKYQYGQRNNEQLMIDESMAHFHYSLRFYGDLVRGQTLQDVQAMVLIALQVRGFPQPGAAWFCGKLALNSAVELGLHRSAAAWSAVDPRPLSYHECEMRKRVFWGLYGLVIGLGGRLGHPLPLRLSDIDIEFPQPVHDNLLEETNPSESGKCSFHVGIAITKLQALFGELYCTFYSLSGCPPQEYEATVARFEADLRTWRNSVHPDIQDPSHATAELHIYALYLKLYELEFLFLLRHPLIMPLDEPERLKEHLNHSRQLLPQILAVLVELRDAKSLDIPWYTVTVFLAAIFTALFAEDQRQEDITEGELNKLQSEMEVCLGILQVIGFALGKFVMPISSPFKCSPYHAGSGARLQHSVDRIIRTVLDTLSRRVAAKSAAVVAAEVMSQSQQSHRRATIAAVYSTAPSYRTIATPAGVPLEAKSEASTAYAAPDEHSLSPTHHQYPTSMATTPSHYSYTDGQPPTDSPYQANPYAHTTYNTSGAEQVPVHGALPTSHGGHVFMAPNTLPYFTNPPASEWLRWSQATLNAFPQAIPPEYMTSTTANTLMTMSGRHASMPNPNQGNTPHHESPNQWPLNVFNVGPHSGNAV